MVPPLRMELGELLNHHPGIFWRTAMKRVTDSSGVKIFKNQDYATSSVIDHRVIQARNRQSAQRSNHLVECHLVGTPLNITALCCSIRFLGGTIGRGNVTTGSGELDDNRERSWSLVVGILELHTHNHSCKASVLADDVGLDTHYCAVGKDGGFPKNGGEPFRGQLFWPSGDRDVAHESPPTHAIDEIVCGMFLLVRANAPTCLPSRISRSGENHIVQKADAHREPMVYTRVIAVAMDVARMSLSAQVRCSNRPRRRQHHTEARAARERARSSANSPRQGQAMY